MKKLIYVLAVLVLAGIFCYSGWQVLDYYGASAESEEAYDQLLTMKEQAIPPRKPRPEPTVPAGPAIPEQTLPTEPQIPDDLVAVSHPQTGESVYMLPEYQDLFTLNPDLVGWISIEGTKVNYPVVQSPTSRTDYYLKRDFYGKSNSRGCIYAREVCDIWKPSDNITIYGHRMNDFSMFGDLGKFKKESFWEDHRCIRFDTLQAYHTYEILAVFQIQAGNADSFDYHLFVDAADAAEFDAFVARCKRLALYDTGVQAQYGDKLITLSTCDYHEDNGRLVVVAKRVG